MQTVRRLFLAVRSAWPRRIALTAVSIALVAVVLLPIAALAHAMFKSSTPTAGARLDLVPRTIRLLFTETLDLTFTRVDLYDPRGRSVPLDSVAFAADSKRAVVVGVRGSLGSGSYTVVWQTAGDDGHPTRGRFSFTIVPGAAGIDSAPGHVDPTVGVTAPGQDAPPATHHAGSSFPLENSFDAESPLYIAIRWLQFTAILIVIGAVAFRIVVLGLMSRARVPRTTFIQTAAIAAARVGFLAVAALGAVAVLRLAAQSYALHGASDAWNVVFIASMLRKTVWGWAWLLQIVGVVITLIGFSQVRGAADSRRARSWLLAAVGAVALVFSPALSGHAVSAPNLRGLAVVADAAHVLGASGWLGSLLFVVIVGIPAALRGETEDRGLAVADLVDAFSPTALAFAGITATTGVFAAWLHLGTVSALWNTAYGQTLLVKLAVLSVVGATGAYNWLRVRPVLGDLEGAQRVRRSASVELAVGALVLAVTAVLVALPTAPDMAATHATGSITDRCRAPLAVRRCHTAHPRSSCQPARRELSGLRAFVLPESRVSDVRALDAPRLRTTAPL